MRAFVISTFALVLATAAAAQDAGAVAEAPEGDTDLFPTVLTPTRLRQSLQDVPASVTIITAEMIQTFGITNIPDALRMVPGMEITQATGNDFRIGYHGTNVLQPRRMNVLIDGVSAYQPLLARVDWANLPIAIQDVARIEVTRGSNSASYGPDSMLAIVNIITKHPADVERAMATVTAGSKGNLSSTARLGAMLGPASIRLTANKESDTGFDYLSRTKTSHDSTNMSRLSLRAQSPLGTASALDFDFGYVEGIRQVPFVEQFQQTFPDIHVHEYFVATTLNHTFSATNELQARADVWSNSQTQSWRSCVPTVLVLPQLEALFTANPAYALAVVKGKVPTGGTAQDNQLLLAALGAIRKLGANATKATCGNANQNEYENRADFELQDTEVISDALRVVVGTGIRKDSGDSQTYLGGYRRDFVSRFFVSAEYKPVTAFTLNFGAYREHDQLSGNSISPRVAANWHLANNQVVRAVWSEGTRTPDVQEQTANWTYSFTNASPPLNGSPTVSFFESQQARGGLKPERVYSTEIGYLLNVPDYGLVFDAKAFDDRLTDLISQKMQVASFDPTNGNSVRLSGIELQVNAQLPNATTVFAQYGYLRNTSATTPYEQTQYSRNSGAVGIARRFDGGWMGSLAYYVQGGGGIGQSSYGRADLTFGRSIALGSHTHLDASILVRRLNRTSQTYAQDIGSVFENSYSSHFQEFGQLKLTF